MAVAVDPIGVVGNVIRSPEASAVRVPLGSRAELNARSGVAPTTLNEKTEGWLFSVKLMDRRLVTVAELAGWYWIVKEVVVLGVRVSGTVGAANDIPDAVDREMFEIVAFVLPVLRTVTEARAGCPMAFAATVTLPPWLGVKVLVFVDTVTESD